MARQTSGACSRHERSPMHLPSHQPHTPTTLISSKLHHRRRAHEPHPPQSPRPSNLNHNFHRLPTHLLLLILLSCIVPLTHASIIYIPEQMVETPKELAPPAPEKPEDPRSALSRLANSGPILVDLSPPPKAAHGQDWTLATLSEDLKRKKRQVGGDEESASSTTSRTKTTSRSSTATPTPTSARGTSTASEDPSSTTSIAVAEETGSTPLPQIFDNGFNGNITDSCQIFMDNMLTNETFKECLPFSLLLQNSNTFFQTTKSVLLTTRLLDHTCSANPNTCSTLLDSLAQNLTSTSNCAADLQTGNPQIHQALLGLSSYLPLYTASCLRNSRTSSYCFADAVTNKTSPSDGYVYYLPLNVSLPGGSTPTCNGCLRDTMAVFSGSAVTTGIKEGDVGQGGALGDTYIPAAQLVNLHCGPTFVNATLALPVKGSAAGFSSPAPTMMGVWALVVVLSSWLL